MAGLTNVKKPNQVAKANRKASGSTRVERKAALKSLARNAAKTKIGTNLSAKADEKKANSFAGDWFTGDSADKARTAAYKAAEATGASRLKAAKLGVKPKKIAKVESRAVKAVGKRMNKAAKR